MKIAYVILAYKYPDLLLRLVNSLSTKNSVFVIHIDQKVDIEPFKKALAKSKAQKVIFAKREKSNWGGLGCIKATLNCIEEAIKIKDVQYLYFLSGQDYPIKSNAYIDDFTNKNKDKIYIDYSMLPKKDWAFGGFDRVQHYHFDIFKSRRTALVVHKIITLLRPILPKRKFPANLKPYGGEFYFSFPRYIAEYIIKFLKLRPDYLVFHRFTWIPEEVFFHTIILNTSDKKIRAKIINDNLRYIDWTREPFPAILGINDLQKILRSNKMFGRKFDLTIDSKVLDALDKNRKE